VVIARAPDFRKNNTHLLDLYDTFHWQLQSPPEFTVAIVGDLGGEFFARAIVQQKVVPGSDRTCQNTWTKDALLLLAALIEHRLK